MALYYFSSDAGAFKIRFKPVPGGAYAVLLGMERIGTVSKLQEGAWVICGQPEEYDTRTLAAVMLIAQVKGNAQPAQPAENFEIVKLSGYGEYGIVDAEGRFICDGLSLAMAEMELQMLRGEEVDYDEYERIMNQQ